MAEKLPEIGSFSLIDSMQLLRMQSFPYGFTLAGRQLCSSQLCLRQMKSDWR